MAVHLPLALRFQGNALWSNLLFCWKMYQHSLQLAETVAAGIRIGTPRSWSASILCWIKMCRKWTSLLYLPCTWPCKCGQSYLVSTNHWSISHERMNPCYATLWSILSRLGLETSRKTCFPPYIFTIFHAMQDLVEIRPAGRSHSASDGGEVPTIQRAERVTLGWPPMKRHLFSKKHMLDGKWSSNFPQVTNPHCKNDLFDLFEGHPTRDAVKNHGTSLLYKSCSHSSVHWFNCWKNLSSGSAAFLLEILGSLFSSTPRSIWLCCHEGDLRLSAWSHPQT